MNFKIIFLFLVIFKLITADTQINCGDWDAYSDEKCYKIITNFTSFNDAKKACYDIDESNLLTIRSQDEQNFVFYLLRDVYKISHNIWLGIEYIANEYKWLDSTALNYTNWANGFPVNESGYECVQMWINQPFNGQWFNGLCNIKNYFMCEKKQVWVYSYLQKTLKNYKEMVNSLRNSLEETQTIVKSLINTLEETQTKLKNLNIDLNQINQKVIETTTPTGTIAYFANATVPMGWLKANGQFVDRTTFSELFSIIGTTFGSGDGSNTFTLPDLRGEFIRGWSDGRDVDKGRTFASNQLGSSIPIVDGINYNGIYAMGTGGLGNWTFAGATFDDGFFNYVKSGETSSGMTFPLISAVYYTDAQYRGTVTAWNVFSGARPKNVALLACIKY